MWQPQQQAFGMVPRLSRLIEKCCRCIRSPGNATVIDAWLHVDESGYLEDGYGETWTGEDAPGNFTSGQFTNTMVGKFDGAMSLSPIVRCQISTHFLQPAYNCQALGLTLEQFGKQLTLRA